MLTPPLFHLYSQLRKEGLLLGIEEYLLLLKALQKGFGLPDRAALERLCKTLWVKSMEEEHIFDNLFERVIPLLDDEDESVLDLPKLSFDLPTRLPKKPEIPPKKPPKPTDFETSTPPDKIEPDTLLDSETDTLPIAIQQPRTLDDEPLVFNHLSSDEYFPVTRRQMKQSWRYFRYPIRQGPPEELDTEATIKQAAELGMLIKLVLVPRRVNRAEIILLLDCGGSMVPFHMLSHRLIETVIRGGHLGKDYIYYFHNCPDKYLYEDAARHTRESIDTVLAQYYPPHTGVLFLSDAGAARGGFNPERIDMTELFLERLRQRFRHIAWLNPMPASRWHGTSAEEIEQMVAMFDLSRRGLDNVVSVLRGRTSHFASYVKENVDE